MTTAQSRFYALLVSSPGGVLESDVSTILYEEDEVACLEDFLKSCKLLFHLEVERDEDKERWFHLSPLIAVVEREGELTKTLFIEVTSELHTRVKTYAARERMTIRELATRALEREMGER